MIVLIFILLSILMISWIILLFHTYFSVLKLVNCLKSEYPAESERVLNPPTVLGIALEHGLTIASNEQVKRLARQNTELDKVRRHAEKCSVAVFFAFLALSAAFILVPLGYGIIKYFFEHPTP